MSPSEILVIELVANSLDAGATRVDISLEGSGPLHILLKDDGHGMRSKGEFEEYHDLGSLTKVRGSGIGWAGIGAKLYIDRCTTIYTETRSTGFSASSEWSFPRRAKAPIWKDIAARGLLGGARGTVVDIMISDPKEIRKFNEEMFRETVLANYNYSMMPYGSAVIRLNEERIQPFDPEELADRSFSLDLRLRQGGHAQGRFYLLKEPAPSNFALISLVVHGKTVGDQYDFRQFARIKEPGRVAGFVFCDRLVDTITTSKDAFNRRSALWREFDKRVGKSFADWLEREGGLEKIKQEVELADLAEELQRDLDRVFATPAVRALGLDLFQSLVRRQVAILQEEGNPGVVLEGRQVTSGTLGGLDSGSGVPTEGDNPGNGVRADPDGSESVVERTRQVRGSVRIAYVSSPDRVERAWADPGLQAIVINTAHEAFKSSDSLESIPFYTIDCCFTVVTETVEDSWKREEIIKRLFAAYLSET